MILYTRNPSDVPADQEQRDIVVYWPDFASEATAVRSDPFGRPPDTHLPFACNNNSLDNAGAYRECCLFP